jgi:hypothetical protein
MRALLPVVGGLLFLAGIVLFVVGIVDTTADAPSGSLSSAATGTPWLAFAGIGSSIAGGVLFGVGLSVASRRRYTPRAGRIVPAAPSAPPSRGPARPQRAAGDPLEQLERLAALRDAGTLTDAEFTEQKARILRDA